MWNVCFEPEWISEEELEIIEALTREIEPQLQELNFE